MERMIEEIFLPPMFDPPWKAHCCKHVDTGQRFRFIAGGFSWPGLKPGFAVVLGVSYEDHPTEKVPVLYCLRETEENDVSRLVRESVNLAQQYMVSGVSFECGI